MKKQVGIWIRVSTEDQAKGESPEHHEKRARAYAEAKDWEIIEVYHLEAVSGKAVLHHPEAERMMRDIKSGKITGLIFSKIARLARNTKELLQIADIFREFNADLISLHESIDTSTPAGRFFYTLISAMAQWEREEIADRISASVPIRAKLGKPLGGQAPYGYEYKDKKLVLNENEATIRKLMYDLFLEHKRKKTVANILNEKGYRTRNGSKFSDTTVKRLLEDPIAKGVRRTNYTRSKGDNKQWELKNKDEWVFTEAPAVISEDEWEEINTILIEQSASRKKPLNRRTNLFTGFVFCACGGRMSIPSQSPKYTCPKCKNKILQDDLEEILHEHLTEFIIDKDNINHYLNSSQNNISEQENRLKLLQNEALKIKETLNNLIALYSKGELPTDGFKDHYNPPFEQLQQVKEEIAQLEGQIVALKQHKENGEYIFNEAKNLYNQWKTFDNPKKRSIIEAITESIIIDKEDVTINLKYLVPHYFLENPQMGNETMSMWLLQSP